LEDEFHQNIELFNSYPPEDTQNLNLKKQTFIGV